MGSRERGNLFNRFYLLKEGAILLGRRGELESGAEMIALVESTKGKSINKNKRTHIKTASVTFKLFGHAFQPKSKGLILMQGKVSCILACLKISKHSCHIY